MSTFKNLNQIATTPARQHTVDILESGLAAINTEQALNKTINLDGDNLTVNTQTYNLTDYQNIFVIGIGKASLDAAHTLENIMGDHITGGIILDIREGKLNYLTSVAGTHPLPSLPNMQATGQIIAILKHVDKNDLVIAIISGGGSALLHWPDKLEGEDMAIITDTLMKKGATIHELNTVRKHVSAIKGGHFARIAYPATIIGLIFSDVPGDSMSMVASGPTYLDTTTQQDAENILAKYKVLTSCEVNNCPLKETPKDPKYFTKVQNEMIVNNQLAAVAMVATATRAGYQAQLYSTTINGEARDVGKFLATLAKPGQAIIAAGETTVTVTKPGKGGRNLELALGALGHIKDNTLVASFASDGRDNTDVAGAFADAAAQTKAKELGIDPAAALLENQSYVFFKQVGTYFDTGPTGVNVSDLIVVLNPKD